MQGGEAKMSALNKSLSTKESRECCLRCGWVMREVQVSGWFARQQNTIQSPCRKLPANDALMF